MNLKIILPFLLLMLPFVGCDDDNIFSGKWTNERNDTLEFEDDGLLYKSEYHFPISGRYYLKNDSIFIWAMHSDLLYDYIGYPIEIGNGQIVLYNFAGMEKTVFVK